VAASLAATPQPARNAIHAASLTYRVNEHAMVSVADCETGGTFDPHAVNVRSGAAGLYQFLASTWQHTPYADMSRFDAYANALAAAWLVRKDGGWSEWSCRP
jgi:Transglycosylase-like domain